MSYVLSSLAASTVEAMIDGEDRNVDMLIDRIIYKLQGVSVPPNLPDDKKALYILMLYIANRG